MSTSQPNAGFRVRDLGLSGITSLGLPLSAAVTAPIFARTIGEVGRGEVVAVTAPLVLSAGIAAAGLAPTAVYFLAGNRANRRDVERRLWLSALAAGILATAVVWTVAPVLLRQSPHLLGATRIGALLLPLIVLGRAGRSVAQADERFDLIAGSGLAAASIRTFGVVALAASGLLDVTTAIVVVVGYEVLLGAPFLGAGARLLVGSVSGSPGSANGLGRRMVRYGSAAAVGSMASIVVVRLDLVVLSPLVSPAELGFYVFAVSLGQLWAGLVGAAARVALPVSVRTGRADITARLSRQLTAATGIVVLVSIVLGPWVVRLVYGEGFEKTASLLPWLVGASGLFALENLPAATLLAEGRPGARSVGPAVTAVFTIAALLIVTPRFGIEGAAAVTVVAYAMAAGITSWLATRRAESTWADYFVLRRGDLMISRHAGAAFGSGGSG